MADKLLPLEGRIALLTDELSLARQWRRPSILMVVYRSTPVRRAAEELLMAELERRGEQLRQVVVTPDRFDVLRLLTAAPPSFRSVFGVSGLRNGGGKGGLNAYHALNVRRELLVDNSLRAIFWLTEAEARRLPRQAPDFWAFRHRLISLADLIWRDGKVRFAAPPKSGKSEHV